MIIAVNFPIQAIGKKKPEKKKSGLLHFHFVYCKGNRIIVDEVDVDTNTGIFK